MGRRPREEACFAWWLENRVYEKRQLSAMSFLRLCQSGKGPKELNELYHPGSDTVTGENSTGRIEGEGYEQNPGNAAEQPGPGSSQDETSPDPSGTAPGFHSSQTGYA